MSGSFSVEDLLSQAAKGAVQPLPMAAPAPETRASAPTTSTPTESAAPAFDIEDALTKATQGKLPQPPKPVEEPGDSFSNVVGAIPSGLYSGVASIANAPTALWNLGARGVQALGGPNLSLQPPINPNPTNYQPQGPIARGVQNASEAVSQTAGMGAAGKLISPLLRAGSGIRAGMEAVSNTSPGVLAASAGGAAAEEPVANQVPESLKPVARLATNLGVGGLTAGLESAVGNIGRSSITPEAANLANLAVNNYQIPLRAAQVSDNRLVKQADSVLKSVPFSGYSGVDDEVRSSMQRAISRTFGEDADKITPQLLNTASKRIGSGLDEVEGNNALNFDNGLTNDLAAIESGARNGLTDEEYGVVSRQINNILSKVQPGDTIQGETYGNLMGHNSPLSRAAANTNPNISTYANDIKNALRDSLQRSLSPDDAAKYTALRTQYKNLKTIEPLTQQADIVGGASPSTGDINFNNLRAAVNKSYPNASRANPGDIPLNDLADVAQRFLKELPSSQTAERSNMMRWIERIGALAGGGGFVGEHFGIPVHEYIGPSALAGAAGAVVPPWLVARGASAALRSEGLANRVINRALNPKTPLQAGVEGMQGAAVPLATTAGIRQLEPSDAPPTARNPTTGLPEYSLKANQQAAEGDMAHKLAGQLVDGSLADHGALSSFVNQNKRELRAQFGGQGIQNLMKVGALVRRATQEQEPSTVLSAILKGANPQIWAQSGNDPQSLIAKAIASPQLTQALAMKSKGLLNKIGQNRIITLLGGSDALDDSSVRPNRNGAGNRSILGAVDNSGSIPGGGKPVRQQVAGTGGVAPDSQRGSGAESPILPPQAQSPRIANRVGV